jgi:APA family basic amino acid/polyamine antiporter
MTNWLNATHDRFNTPHRAILATGAVTTLLIALGLEVADIVALLAEVASFSFLVSYALVHVSLVSFRRADPPEYDPDFVLPDLLYPAVPVTGVLMTVFVISRMETIVQGVGTGIVVLGVIWYFVYARSRDVESGLLLDTFREPDRPYRVAVPVANPETQRGLLQLAAATARIHADDGTPQLVAINVVEGESSPDTNVDAGRLTSQRELLAAADEVAEDIGIDLQTRAVVAPDTGQAIVDIAEEAEAAQLLLGWDGELARGEYVFGRTIDPAIREASCEVSLVSVETEIGQPVALAGPGPHAPVAARRAAEFAAVADETPVLLNVQSPDGDDPVARGRDAIDWIADRADLAPDEYESEVVVSDDTEAAIVDAVAEYDTVCVGLSEKSETERVLFGSIAERISRAAPGNVGIIRGELGRIVDESGEEGTPAAD